MKYHIIYILTVLCTNWYCLQSSQLSDKYFFVATRSMIVVFILLVVVAVAVAVAVVVVGGGGGVVVVVFYGFCATFSRVLTWLSDCGLVEWDELSNSTVGMPELSNVSTG